MSASFSVGRRTVGSGHPVLIIAELAWAHDGSIDKAIRIADGAATAGADAFSIHVTSLPDYMVRKYGNAGTVSAGKPADAIFAYLEQINLPPEQVQRLVHAVRERQMAVCLMPNDHPSLQLSKKLAPDALVLSPASFVEDDFVDAVGASGVPVVLRVGGATLDEIDAAVGRLRRAGARDLLLLHGFQTYPTRLEETNLRVLPVLGQTFDCPTGLADHLDGGDPLAMTIPALAVAVGAVALEKHITWDRAERGEDFESALDPQQFAAFVRYVRQAETALGAATMPQFSDDVLRYRQVVRKRVVAAVDLQGGTILEARHLACKRSDEGCEPAARATFVGRRLRSAIRCDTPITGALLE